MLSPVEAIGRRSKVGSTQLMTTMIFALICSLQGSGMVSTTANYKGLFKQVESSFNSANVEIFGDRFI